MWSIKDLPWSQIFSYFFLFYLFLQKKDTEKFHPVMFSALKSKISWQSLHHIQVYSSSWSRELWIKEINFLFPHTLFPTIFSKGRREISRNLSITKILKFHWANIIKYITLRVGKVPWLGPSPTSYNWLHSSLFPLTLYSDLWEFLYFPCPNQKKAIKNMTYLETEQLSQPTLYLQIFEN